MPSICGATKTRGQMARVQLETRGRMARVQASRAEIAMVEAVATTIIYHEFINSQGETGGAHIGRQALWDMFQEVVTDFKEWIQEYDDWSHFHADMGWYTEERLQVIANSVNGFVRKATAPQVEVVVDHLIPLFIENLRRRFTFRPRLRTARGALFRGGRVSGPYSMTLAMEQKYHRASLLLSGADPTKHDKVRARLNWKRTVPNSYIAASLLSSHLRAAERTYAPGGKGAAAAIAAAIAASRG